MGTKTKAKTKKKKEKEDDLSELKKDVKNQVKDTFKKKRVELKLNSDVDVWKNLIKKVKGLKEEITLNFRKEGIIIKETDESTVSLVNMTIKKSCFAEYISTNEFGIGVNLDKLHTHLRIFDKDVTITNGNRNRLLFKGEKGRQSRMGVLTPLDNDATIPKYEYDVELKAKANNIQRMIEIGDAFRKKTLDFVVEDSHFYIIVDADTDEVRFPICSVKHLTDEKNFLTKYSIEYLKKLMNFEGKENLILKFGEDMPLVIDYEDDNQKIYYLLAPRIECD